MNFENQSKKSKYVVIAAASICAIILVAVLLSLLGLTSNGAETSQIDVSESITTETTTTTSSSSTSTTETTTASTTTSTSLTTSTSTSVTSKSTSTETSTTKKTEETVKNTQPVTEAPIINEPVATQPKQPVADPPVETTTVKESSDTEVTTETSETTTETVIETEPPTTDSSIVDVKSNEELAQEVIHGLWGNGPDRVKRLTDAGYDYNAVQKIVDEIMKSAAPVATPVEGAGTTYVKNFSRGTYYAYGGPRQGGSGRQLIDCSQGDGTVKGSIASSYLYNNYGYNYNGKRTMVYLEISGYPSMAGYYYLDDSDAGNSNVIDFFYLYNSNCQFQYQGVVSVDCYIVTY